MHKSYQTDRLVLKVLDKTDAPMVLDYFVRNKEFLSQWEPTRGVAFFTRAYQRMLLEAENNAIAEGSMLKLWLFKRGDADNIIGSIAYNNIIRGAFLSCQLGYRLDRDEINRGYITEAVKRGNGVMFEDHGMHRIEANVMPGNAASLRVMEKAGFSYVGLEPRYLRINGEWEDHMHFVLINEACGDEQEQEMP